MIPFPFNENQFSFFVADHLLVGQLFTNPKSDRSLLSCLKVTQCSMSEIGDAPYTTQALYWSKLWQRDHCQHPQNANSGVSTLEGAAQCIRRPFGVGGADGQRQEDPDKGVHRKGPGNHWWNSPVAYLADCQRFRRLTHNCECICEGGLQVQVQQALDNQILTEKTKNLRLIKSVRPPSSPDLNLLDSFIFVENITNLTSHNTKASLIAAIHRVFAELPPVPVEKACS